MSELRTRMDNDMIIRGLADRTRKSYLAAVTGLAKYYQRPPDKISEQEVQAYLLHMIKDRGLSWSTCNLTVAALRFLYNTTLSYERGKMCVPAAKHLDPAWARPPGSRQAGSRCLESAPGPGHLGAIP